MTPVNSLEILAQVYPKTVEQIQEWTELGLALAHQEIDQIIAIENKTFENTIKALDLSFSKLQRLSSILGMIKCVHPDENIRNAIQEILTILQNVSIDFSMDEKLYQALQNYADQNQNNQNLDDQDNRLLNDYLDSFKANGLHLSQEKQEKIKQTTKNLAQMREDFLTNINNSNPKIIFTKNELAGLSEQDLASFKKNDELYILNCDCPTYAKIMQECSIANTRRAMFFVINNQAYPENDILLTQILEKQDELASLLDYPNYATLNLKGTSAQTIKNVQNFEEKILNAALSKAHAEIELLKTDLPNGVICKDDGSLNPWDYLYSFNAYKKKHFNIDESEIAKYFPTEKVIDGVFEIYQNFLGLTFKKVTPLWSWHEDVKLIEIYKTESGQLLGYLFLDLYPRDNKYSHACHYGHIDSYFTNGQHTPSVATIITNFPKPCGDIPGLLQHNDVVTFFHEFGHAMHNLLSKTKHVGQSGITVADDFVEVPSQMFEQWMYEPKMLAIVSSHYLTGETLTAEKIEQKLKLRQANTGFIIARQCLLGLFALQLMTKNDLSYNPTALWKSLHDTYWQGITGYEDNNHWHTTFGHLTKSYYGSKYFCYLWTEAIALDFFAEIKAHEYNPEYKSKVLAMLSAGNSVEATELIKNFLGRESNQKAFFKTLGFK